MTFDWKLVKRQPANSQQINKILEKAFKAFATAKKIVDENFDVGFTTAYDAMLLTTLALMLSKDFRPKTRLGHHLTLVNYARYVLGKNFENLTTTYNKMRKKRNEVIYGVESVTETEALHAISIAEKYFEVVEDKIAQDNPQQPLWRP